MSISRAQGDIQRLRIAVIAIAVAIVFAIVLLIRGGDYLFTVFTVIGPGLLLLAMAMLAWHILDELRSKKVL